MKTPLDREIAEILSDLDNASRITEMILMKSISKESDEEEISIELKDGTTIELAQVNSSESVPVE